MARFWTIENSVEASSTSGDANSAFGCFIACCRFMENLLLVEAAAHGFNANQAAVHSAPFASTMANSALMMVLQRRFVNRNSEITRRSTTISVLPTLPAILSRARAVQSEIV